MTAVTTTRLGRYLLGAEIGRGGMATVHVGRHLAPHGFDRFVAIKRLHRAFARDPELVAMLLDEAKLASRIHHANVVPVTDIVSTSNELCLVMDYVHGLDLAAILEAGGPPLPVGVVARIAIDALRGLHAAHEATDLLGRPLELVHRDVSPHNLLVGLDGVTRVVDFGVAKGRARYQVTREGHVKGKVAYMAPEQIAVGEVDRRTDVFGLGIVLWELLAGQRMFGSSTPGATVRKILASRWTAPSKHRSDVPKALDEVVLRALAKDAGERFDDALAMSRAIATAFPAAAHEDIAAWIEPQGEEGLAERARHLQQLARVKAEPAPEVTRPSAAVREVLARPILESATDAWHDVVDDETTTTLHQDNPTDVRGWPQKPD